MKRGRENFLFIAFYSFGWLWMLLESVRVEETIIIIVNCRAAFVYYLAVYCAFAAD